ncbi:RHS repeat-associated core domain-containing protein, partial [Caballeronia sp. LZ008]|uniref:RHS repeat-associated core domain-containing protein n=2 Tax=Caballeronia TaxID=1827195 RepID=UPI0028679702
SRHATLFYQNDHLGTPQELLDESGKVVWLARYRAWGGWKPTPYGKTDAAEADNAIRFQGQYADDETGLTYNRHRYYDSSSGRYITQDPIGLAGGVNLYQYAPNPIQWMDPLGLTPCCLTSRAARREAMRQAGIPTSQQPISQSRNASGYEYRYNVPQAGGGTIEATVQQQTMDVSHKEDPHWEAGKVKVDPISGETRMTDYDRPKIANPKGKAYYGSCQ